MENEKKSPEPKNKDDSRSKEDSARLKRRLFIVGGIVIALFVALLIVGTWTRLQTRKRLAGEAKENAKVTVSVLQVRKDWQAHPLYLPGNVTAFQETKIFARVDGYLAKWLVDIGDRVQTGQLLAVIDAPEIDKELDQARATKQQTAANLEIARISAARTQTLLNEHIVPAQSNDEAQADYHAREADVTAAQANVERLEKTQGFEQVMAPFAGTITERPLDIGALISSGGNGTMLFHLAQTDPLRIFVNVPQPNASSIHEGLTASVFAQELPNQSFPGKVSRTAGAIDPTSRTLLVEVDVPNHERILYAGMYAQVVFDLVNTNAPAIIPASAFVFRAEGPQVITVTKDKHIHWQLVQVKQDNGTNLEISAGLEENTLVVVNPSDDLQEGMEVELKMAKESNSKANGGSK